MKNEMIAEPVKTAGKYKQTEVGVIPEDWEVKRLFEIAHFRNGKAHEQFIVEDGDYKVVNSKFISTEGAVYKQAKVSIEPLHEGEIAMVMSDIPNGKALAKCFLVDKANSYTLNQRICAIKANDVNSEFLFRVLNRNKYYLDFDSGSGQTNLRKQDVLNCPLPIPKVYTEQTAIAEALSDADAMIASLEKLIDKKKKIKQGAMQELLHPKEGWVEMNLTDIVNYIHGKAHERNIVEEGRYTVVNSKFISSDGQVAKYSNLNNCPARKGDVLTVLSDLPNGKALAKCFLVDSDNKYAVNQRVCIWRTKGADPVFLSYILNRHKYFLGLDDGVSQTHILNKHIEGFRLMFPTDLKYQQESGIALRKLDEEIHLLNTKLSKCQMIKQGMMQNLLTGKIRLI
jgi:type I restriction enzyme S subunit